MPNPEPSTRQPRFIPSSTAAAAPHRIRSVTLLATLLWMCASTAADLQQPAADLWPGTKPVPRHDGALAMHVLQNGNRQQVELQHRGLANAAWIAQRGESLHVSLEQSGAWLQAYSVQQGNDNRAALRQAGSHNAARIWQGGVGNRADVDQVGGDGFAEIHQLGDANTASITQRGNEQHARIHQIGSHNVYHLELLGPEAARISVSQFGDNAPPVIISSAR